MLKCLFNALAQLQKHDQTLSKHKLLLLYNIMLFQTAVLLKIQKKVYLLFTVGATHSFAH